jgi:F0F1-type ATP synthase membrane subunit c/vacuolar-type H+-ATPase subunit K
VGAWANKYDFLMGIVFGVGIGVAGGIANGIVLGAITGSTLLWLLRQPGAVEP